MGDGYQTEPASAFYDVQVHQIETEDTEKLQNQVAGHTHTGGVLKHKKGYALKPIQDDARGRRELNFYTTVNASCNKSRTLELLHKSIPRFYGVANIQQNGTGGKYLMLEDVCTGFCRPCIVDVKIGAQTWNPSATPEKIECEKKKYVGTKTSLGLSITGMHYYDVVKKAQIRMENGFGKKLDPYSIYQVFKDFLNEEAGVHKYIAKRIRFKLKNIEQFFENQKELAFYGSSLLIAYDAQYIEDILHDPNFDADDEKNYCEDKTWIRVYMIDFAHVFPLEPSNERDENYIFGLKNFIKLMSDFASDKSELRI